MFAPYFLEPQPFMCYTSGPRRCRASCSPCPFPFVLLMPLLLLAAPCLLCFAFKLFVFALFVGSIGYAAGCVGDFLCGEATRCEPNKKSTAKPCEKKSVRPPPDQSTVSVTSDDTSLIITVSAPGVATHDLDVKLQAGEPPVLTVKGQSKVAGSCRGVDRTIMLPKDLDLDAMSAHHADGLLTVKVPRKVAPSPKPIKIEKVAPPATSPAASTSASASAALLTQIRGGVELKKTQGPPPNTAPPVVAAEPTAPAPVEDGSQSVEWEVVKETAASVDDDLVAELVDMGFTDGEHNAALLKKHGGSLKAVIKELVAQRRSPHQKSAEATAIEEAAG